MKETRPILLIDDSDEDFASLAWIWRRSAIAVPLVRCKDGEDALEWLLGTGRYLGRNDTGNPALILLDLNMPRSNGAAVLSALKLNPLLQTTPVVILTTSSNPADVEACYRGGANGYITKSLDVEDMEVSIRKLVSFWLEVASLPQGEFHGRG